MPRHRGPAPQSSAVAPGPIVGTQQVRSCRPSVGVSLDHSASIECLRLIQRSNESLILLLRGFSHVLISAVNRIAPEVFSDDAFRHASAQVDSLISNAVHCAKQSGDFIAAHVPHSSLSATSNPVPSSGGPPLSSDSVSNTSSLARPSVVRSPRTSAHASRPSSGSHSKNRPGTVTHSSPDQVGPPVNAPVSPASRSHSQEEQKQHESKFTPGGPVSAPNDDQNIPSGTPHPPTDPEPRRKSKTSKKQRSRLARRTGNSNAKKRHRGAGPAVSHDQPDDTDLPDVDSILEPDPKRRRQFRDKPPSEGPDHVVATGPAEVRPPPVSDWSLSDMFSTITNASRSQRPSPRK